MGTAVAMHFAEPDMASPEPILARLIAIASERRELVYAAASLGVVPRAT